MRHYIVHHQPGNEKDQTEQKTFVYLLDHLLVSGAGNFVPLNDYNDGDTFMANGNSK